MLVGLPSPLFLHSIPFHSIPTPQIKPLPLLRKGNYFLEKKRSIAVPSVPQMKIFSWMRSTKRNGNEATTKPNPQPNSYGMMHEEFSDWPNGLLAIGTFGNKHNHSQKLEQVEPPELRRLVINKDLDSTENENENLSVDQLLDCLHHDGDDEGRRLERQISLVQRGKKEIQSEKRNRGGMSKTSSLSFLIKKALLCRGGFVAAPPILRDPLPDPKVDHSTMEKILRAMLHKKIYPQRPTPKKYLDIGEGESEEEERESEKTNHESKWVKTDSEYIVLEI